MVFYFNYLSLADNEGRSYYGCSSELLLRRNLGIKEKSVGDVYEVP
jgi:hypothetical protein